MSAPYLKKDESMNPFTTDDPARTAPPRDGYEISSREHEDALAEIMAEKLRATRRHAGLDYVIEALTESDNGPRICMEIGEIIADGLESGWCECDDEEIGSKLRELVVRYLAETFETEIDDRASAHHAAQAEDARDFWDEQGRVA